MRYAAIIRDTRGKRLTVTIDENGACTIAVDPSYDGALVFPEAETYALADTLKRIAAALTA